jgi:hypothetical protein
LASLSEAEVHTLLQEEIEGKKRATILIRLHQRYSTLRANRERSEILLGAVKL